MLDASSTFQVPRKAILDRRYVHVDAFELLPLDDLSKLSSAETLAKVTRGQHFNIARFDNLNEHVSLLNYPNFFIDAFPSFYSTCDPS